MQATPLGHDGNRYLEIEILWFLSRNTNYHHLARSAQNLVNDRVVYHNELPQDWQGFPSLFRMWVRCLMTSSDGIKQRTHIPSQTTGTRNDSGIYWLRMLVCGADYRRSFLIGGAMKHVLQYLNSRATC
jgi:hypothetical protein